MNRHALAIFATLTALASPPVASGADTSPVRLPPGFRVELYADETLADDIQAMTLDRGGRVVVTGPGYVKTLHDDPKTSRAGRATLFASPKSGGQGMCFDGDDLLITADHWLSRYRDSDGDGRADGALERILPLATAEHGGHAIRKGPDGWFYVVGGNDAGIDARHVRTSGSPIHIPIAGSIVRLSPDLKTSEVVAHGFRNPYDFDFDPRGALFTYDSDCERDAFLPWSTPTRLFDAATGGHHGWRLNGYLRSFARRPDQFDAIPPVADLGRGSPTGVACYRHASFPARYRGGLFLCDWTFGRIYFIPPQPSPSGNPRPEVFLEPVGEAGFAPTDVCVAPDGALLVCIGGRKTRGAVYRITHGGTASALRPAGPDVERVLDAPQPLDSWSRDVWEPIARRLGPGPFELAVGDASRGESSRIRAVEVLVDLFDGPRVEVAEAAWGTAPDPVRARVAWALGRRTGPIARPARLVNDRTDLAIQVALLELAARGRLDRKDGALAAGLGYESPRIIPAIEAAWRNLTAPEKARLAEAAARGGPRAKLNHALAKLHIDDDLEGRTVRAALEVLDELAGSRAPTTPNRTLDALRLLVVAFGDWDLDRAEADAFVPYTLTAELGRRAGEVEAIRAGVRRIFPSGDERIDEEASRLLAMLGDEAESTRRAVVAKWTDSSPPTRDLHYLIVFARLRSPVPPEHWPRVAETLVRLDPKLAGKQGRIKQTWNFRVGELFAKLSKEHPALVDALVSRPDFVKAAQVDWAVRVDPSSRVKVARAFFDATRRPDDGPDRVDAAVLDLFDALPQAEVLDALRTRTWAADLEGTLRRLAERPTSSDRRRFVEHLGSPDPKVSAAALQGLERLPRIGDPADAARALGKLGALIRDPVARAERERLAAWVAREMEVPAPGPEPAGPSAMAGGYKVFYEHLFDRYPAMRRSVELPSLSPPPTSLGSLARVEWARGSADRGRAAYERLRCASCHGGGNAMGPDLAGVGRRMSRDDLFAAIIDPSRDVAPAYRPTVLDLKDGRARTGFVVFESADGIMLQTAPSTLERIPGAEIDGRRVVATSLMPAGLIAGATDVDLADLYAYLKSL